MVSQHPSPPPGIDARISPRCWEGDLIEAARNALPIGTLIDATTATAATVFGSILNHIDAQ